MQVVLTNNKYSLRFNAYCTETLDGFADFEFQGFCVGVNVLSFVLFSMPPHQ